MRQVARWLTPSCVAVTLLALGCQGLQQEVQEPERVTSEPEPVTDPVETAPAAEAPKQEERELQGAALAVPTEEDAVSARNVWASGKQGSLLRGLDGGLYEPYDVRIIEAVQKALKAQGLYSGAVHQYLDEETMKALGEFQKQKNLQVSGVPTPRTREALLTENEPDAG